MDKNTFLLAFRYLVLFIVVYMVLKFLPNQQMNDFDIIILTSIIFLMYLLIENLLSMFTTSSSEPYCNTVCKSTCDNKIENMENIKALDNINLNDMKARLSQLEKAYAEKAKQRVSEDKVIQQTNNQVIKALYEKKMEEESVMDKQVEEEQYHEIE